MPSDDSSPPSGSVLRRGWGLIRAVVSLHPRPFLTAVGSAAVFATLTVASAWAMSRLIDRVVLPRFEQGRVGAGTFAGGAGLVIAIGIARGAAVVMRRAFAGRAQWRVARTLTGSVTDRILAQPQSWQDRFSTGDLVARTGVDVDAAVAVMAPLPFASSTIVLILVAAGWLLSLDLVLGAVAVAMFPLLAGLNVMYQHRVERHTTDAQDFLGNLSAAVHESFDGVMLVKALGAEDREADRLATVAAQLLQARVKAVRIRSTFDSVMNNMPTLASVALVAIGAWRIERGHLTVGELTSVLYLFTLIALPIRLIGFALSEMPYSLAGWDRLRQVLDDPVAPPADRAVTVVAGAGVAVEDLSFAFEPDRPVIDRVSFAIGAGRVAALVGATGSGKTTLLELIAGLYTPDAGSVVRPPGRCALVLQEAFLFGESIEQNLVLGGRDADPSEIARALAVADAAEFVDRLPSGTATVMGERGVSVSGGQRQRLALARAVVSDPSVLLLDDTTSALDPATEARVLANLRRELGGVTTLIVASRPSTIALADEVVFLENGRVVAVGAHAQLYAEHPGYRALVDAYEIERQGAES